MGCLGGLRWGTWEELLLGGAVLRHGTDAWVTVSAELTARTTTASPGLIFTPQECQAKYEDIQEQYSGCDAWFEELRKRRVAELKRELEKSEDSIGSLQSKLESLTSDRETGSNFGYNTSQNESTSPVEETDGIDSSSKEVSRDGSSAGSFTEIPGRSWTGKCQNLTLVSLQEKNPEAQLLEHSLKEKFGCGCFGLSFGIYKKKRGKRKRKGCNIVKESSMEDNDMLSSAEILNREGSAEGSNRDTKLPSEDCDGTGMCEDDGHLDLAGIMDSIMSHKDVSIFRSRLEGQKRARYKKMIRRHVDFHNISSRIGNGSISSTKELFRDLLLLCNNVLVFYPNDSSEHKSALVLRDLVNRTLRRSFSSWSPTHSCSDDEGVATESDDSPKKLRTTLQHSTAKKALVAANADGTSVKENAMVASKAVGTSVKENAVVAVKADGISFKENAAVAGKGPGTSKNAQVTGKGAGVAKNAPVAGNGDETPLKKNAVVASKRPGSSVKENAAAADKKAGSSVKENGAAAGKREGTPIKPRGSNKGSRPDIAVESPGRKMGIRRPVKGGQRGGKRRQDQSPNKGRKRARR